MIEKIIVAFLGKIITANHHEIRFKLLCDNWRHSQKHRSFRIVCIDFEEMYDKNDFDLDVVVLEFVIYFMKHLHVHSNQSIHWIH